MTVTMWLIALVALAALAAMAAWARRDERVRDAELKEIRDHADRLGARFDERLPEMMVPGPRHGEKVTVCGYEWTIM